jgi:hypothetical protein
METIPKKGENMKKEIVPTQASSLSTLEDIDTLVERIREEIQERPEVAEITAKFKKQLEVAEIFEIKSKLHFESAGNIRKGIAMYRKSLEKEVHVTSHYGRVSKRRDQSG